MNGENQPTSIPSRWARITVSCPPAAAEAVSAIIVGIVGYSIQIEDKPGHSRIHVFVSEAEDADAIELRIRESLSCLPNGGVEFTFDRGWVEESDWAGSLKGREPIPVGERFVVRFVDVDDDAPAAPEMVLAEFPGRQVIELQSQMAFGTGDHPTTELCLEALERLVEKGDRIFDVGTGSGILSFAAARLGSAEVLGVDNDPTAVAVAQRHAERNGVNDCVTILQGEGMQHATGQYDIVVANVLATVIGPLCPIVARYLKPGGYYIASGATERCENELKEDFEEAGFTVVAVDRRREWICIIGRYPEG